MKTPTELEPWRLPSAHVTIEAILAEVEAAFGYNRGALQKRDKSNRIAWARQVAMTLAVDTAGLSQSEVGRLLKRDHTTVGHGLRAVRDLTSVHLKLKAEIDQIRARIQQKIAAPENTSKKI